MEIQCIRQNTRLMHYVYENDLHSAETTFTGHSCLIIEGSKKLLFDPMPLDDPSAFEADLTLISHAHVDHIGDSPERFSLTVAVHELSGYLKSLGVPTIGMNIGGSVDWDGITVRMVHAAHSSSIRQKDGTSFYMGQACGLVSSTMDASM